MMTAAATNLDMVVKFCTFVAALTLKQLIAPIKPKK